MGQRAALIALLLGGPAFAECSDHSVELKTTNGSLVRFTVEFADTVAERALGLMSRPSMASSKGMLFVYDHPQTVAYWMENTLIPLDMLFIDETGLVKKVHSNAKPHDRTPIPGGDDIQYVLEINGGLAKGLGLTEGSVLRALPLDQGKAVWTCTD